MDTLLGTARSACRVRDARRTALPLQRPTGPVLRRIPRARLTRRVQIRPGLSTLLERSVAVPRRHDQHQRRVFGVCDALVGG
jgi:hypothetical protein